MSVAWTVSDKEGRELPGFAGATRLDVARKVVSTRYDAFRLQVSSSYREMLCRDFARVLALRDWRVVRTRGQRRKGAAHGAQLELQLH